MKKLKVWLQKVLGYGYCRFEIKGISSTYNVESEDKWTKRMPLNLIMYIKKIQRLYDTNITAIHVTNSKQISELYNLPYLAICIKESFTLMEFEINEPDLIRENPRFILCKDMLEEVLGTKDVRTLFFNFQFNVNGS